MKIKDDLLPKHINIGLTAGIMQSIALKISIH